MDQMKSSTKVNKWIEVCSFALPTLQLVSVFVKLIWFQPSAGASALIAVIQSCLNLYYAIAVILELKSPVIIRRRRIKVEGMRASSFIVNAYLILLMVNANYISLIIIPIIMLIFIKALCTQSSRGIFSRDQARVAMNEYLCVLFICNMLGLFQFHGGDVLVVSQFSVFLSITVSQFFVFLSITLLVLTSMLARLPSPEVGPALDVLRKAYLVMVLLSAHTMAVELLGEDVVLAIIPELVVVLLWFSSHLGHGGTTVITIDKATSPEATVLTASLGAVMAFVAYTAASMEESDEGLLAQYKTAVFACAVSLILLSVSAFALRRWPAPAVQETKDTPTFPSTYLLRRWPAPAVQETKDTPTFPSTYRNGPWGGCVGAVKDIIAVPRRLEIITIRSGSVIDSLEFSYISEDGQRHISGPWGGDGGNKQTFYLDLNEFIKEVLGTTGTYKDNTVVRSLKFVTNIRTYGPFGREQSGGTPFSSYGTVVAFHGSSGHYLNSIGTYTLSQPTLNGPWGGCGGALKSITEVPRRLVSIVIRSDWVIDSIEFTYIGEDGQRHTEGPWGGVGGYEIWICLNPTEFIKEVSGTTGIYKEEVVVRSLKFVTNMATYGPFGREQSGGTRFCSYGTVVGFHGRSGNHLYSIGTYTV